MPAKSGNDDRKVTAPAACHTVYWGVDPKERRWFFVAPADGRVVTIGEGQDLPEMIDIVNRFQRDVFVCTGAVLLEFLLRLGREQVLWRGTRTGGHAAERSPSETIELTGREKEVLLLLYRGLHNEAIAAQLGVKLPTVKGCLGKLFLKLGVDCRCQLISRAVDMGIIQPTMDDGQGNDPEPPAAPRARAAGGAR